MKLEQRQRIIAFAVVAGVLAVAWAWLGGEQSTPGETPEGGWIQGKPAADLATKPAAEGVPSLEIEGRVQDVSGGRIVLMLPDESDVFSIRFDDETEFSPPKDDIPINALVTVHATIRDGVSYADFVQIAER